MDVSTGGIDVDGQADLDEVVVAGLSTFNSLIDANAGVNIAAGLIVDQINSAGVATIGGDVSIADKIVHTGDTNTALRFPTADTFTIETGGTEAFRVASDQKVYFGDFASAGSKAYIEKEVSGDYKLNIHASSSTSQNRAITINSREDVEALRITADGNIAIGTITASDLLHAEGSAAVARFVGNRTDALGPRLSLAKSRGSTSGSATIVQDGDEIGQIMFKGADGTDVDSTGAAIIGLVDGSPGNFQ